MNPFMVSRVNGFFQSVKKGVYRTGVDSTPDGSGLFIREDFDSLFAMRTGACRVPREELVA